MKYTHTFLGFFIGVFSTNMLWADKQIDRVGFASLTFLLVGVLLFYFDDNKDKN